MLRRSSLCHGSGPGGSARRGGATRGRVIARLVKATSPPEHGTGWHRHTAGWHMVLMT